MDKQQVIEFVKNQLAAGVISQADLNNIPLGVTIQSGGDGNSKPHASIGVVNVLYAIGGLIVLIGIAILLAQNWNDIGFFGRVLSTLGIAVTTYVAGLIMRQPDQNVLSQVMFIISSTLFPFGAYVAIHEGNTNFTLNLQIVVSLALVALFTTAWFVTKRNILVLINVGIATWTYYAFLVKVLGVSYYDADWIKWSTILLGVAYLFLAYGYAKRGLLVGEAEDSKAVAGFLYGAGTLAALGGGIAVGGVFDLLFILVLFCAFYGSVFLKSRAMLIFSALFLVAHMIKLTGEYFVDSIGWPVALVVSGFVIIGVGYFTYYLNKKYLTLS